MEVESFCRFCAEFKPVGKLCNLQSDVSLCKEIKLKVKFIQANFVNLFLEGKYPAAVCFVCKEALDQAYTFFKKVKKAQEIVSDLLTNPELFRLASEQSTVVEESCIKSELPEDDILPQVDNPEIPNQVILEEDISVEEIPKDAISEEVISKKIIFEEGVPEFDESCNNEFVDGENDDDDTTSETSLHQEEEPESTDDNLNPKSWNHMRWLCAYCSDEFKDIQSLRSHAKSTHYRCRAFKCPECTTYSGSKCFNGFIRHVCKHFHHLRQYCIHCNLRFESTRAMLAHSKDHLRDKVLCVSCGYVFDNEEEVEKHRNVYVKKCKPRYKNPKYRLLERTCKICNKVFQSTIYLPKHMMTVHRDSRYECDHCGKSFTAKGPLVTHLKSHVKRDLTCKICNKTFRLPSRLVTHVNLHSGARMFQCDECGKSYGSMYQLNQHKVVHSDEMPFKCEVCKKQFRRKSALRKHMFQHTGEKPYTCDVCDKVFTNLPNRNKHMKRIHKMNVAKPFKIIEKPTKEIQKWKAKIMK